MRNRQNTPNQRYECLNGIPRLQRREYGLDSEIAPTEENMDRIYAAVAQVRAG